MSQATEESQSLFAEIARAIRDRIQAEPFFSNIEVITFADEDIEDDLQRKVSSAGGLLVLVSFESATSDLKNTDGAQWEPITYIVTAIEDPTINRASGGTNKIAVQLLEYASALFANYVPPGLANIRLGGGIQAVPNNEYLQYDLELLTSGGVKIQ